MAFSGTIPAWVLMPYRAVCRTNPVLSEGFREKQQAKNYIKRHAPHEFDLLEDENND